VTARPLLERDLHPEPLMQFEAWFSEARGTELELPEAMALATVSADGSPSVRMVLLKGFDERGFVFFTSYESRKGRELAENPRAAVLIHSPGRQVRVEGAVERIPPDESDAYWASRPRGSQIAATVSSQSEPIESREALEERFADFGEGHPAEIPRPSHWGGYRLVPHVYEFWEHRENRLHDRVRYRREGEGWTRERLQP
jgi:pyridoxamine 5'-phosphate oxidase